MHKNVTFIRVALLALICLDVNSVGGGEPLIQKLPKDGVGQKYHINLVIDGNEQIQEWTLQSVGRKIVDGKPARWIEMVGGPKSFPIIYKVLVPETEFGIGKHPLSKATETWRKRGDDVAQKLKNIKTDDIFFWYLLGGPDDVKKLDEKHQIDWQGGTFDCQVKVGASRFDLGIASISVKHRIYVSAASPFGPCGGRHEFQGQLGGRQRKATIEYNVIDIIKDAKPVLADIK